MNLHLVSDSTGETLNSIARATLARFEDRQVIHHRWSLIRSRLQLDRVLEGLQHDPGPVLFTLVDRSLRHALEESCERLGVPHYVLEERVWAFILVRPNGPAEFVIRPSGQVSPQGTVECLRAEDADITLSRAVPSGPKFGYLTLTPLRR